LSLLFNYDLSREQHALDVLNEQCINSNFYLLSYSVQALRVELREKETNFQLNARESGNEFMNRMCSV
jgi:hypothetical protein